MHPESNLYAFILYTVRIMISEVGNAQLSKMYTVVLQFPFTGTKGTTFHNDSAPVHKIKYIKIWFAKAGI